MTALIALYIIVGCIVLCCTHLLVFILGNCIGEKYGRDKMELEIRREYYLEPLYDELDRDNLPEA